MHNCSGGLFKLTHPVFLSDHAGWFRECDSRTCILSSRIYGWRNGSRKWWWCAPRSSNSAEQRHSKASQACRCWWLTSKQFTRHLSVYIAFTTCIGRKHSGKRCFTMNVITIIFRSRRRNLVSLAKLIVRWQKHVLYVAMSLSNWTEGSDFHTMILTFSFEMRNGVSAAGRILRHVFECIHLCMECSLEVKDNGTVRILDITIMDWASLLYSVLLIWLKSHPPFYSQ